MVSWDWLMFGSAATLESRQNVAMYILQWSKISQLNGKWANRWSAVPVIHRKTLKTFRKGVLSDGNVNVDGVIIVKIRLCARKFGRSNTGFFYSLYNNVSNNQSSRNDDMLTFVLLTAFTST